VGQTTLRPSGDNGSDLSAKRIEDPSSLLVVWITYAPTSFDGAIVEMAAAVTVGEIVGFGAGPSDTPDDCEQPAINSIGIAKAYHFLLTRFPVRVAVHRSM